MCPFITSYPFRRWVFKLNYNNIFPISIFMCRIWPLWMFLPNAYSMVTEKATTAVQLWMKSNEKKKTDKKNFRLSAISICYLHWGHNKFNIHIYIYYNKPADAVAMATKRRDVIKWVRCPTPSACHSKTGGHANIDCEKWNLQTLNGCRHTSIRSTVLSINSIFISFFFLFFCLVRYLRKISSYIGS